VFGAITAKLGLALIHRLGKSQQVTQLSAIIHEAKAHAVITATAALSRFRHGQTVLFGHYRNKPSI
jgi:hypothetical protein